MGYWTLRVIDIWYTSTELTSVVHTRKPLWQTHLMEPNSHGKINYFSWSGHFVTFIVSSNTWLSWEHLVTFILSSKFSLSMGRFVTSIQRRNISLSGRTWHEIVFSDWCCYFLQLQCQDILATSVSQLSIFYLVKHSTTILLFVAHNWSRKGKLVLDSKSTTFHVNLKDNIKWLLLLLEKKQPTYKFGSFVEYTLRPNLKKLANFFKFSSFVSSSFRVIDDKNWILCIMKFFYRKR